MKRSQESAAAPSNNFVDVQFTEGEMKANCILAVVQASTLAWFVVVAAICAGNWAPIVNFSSLAVILVVIVVSMVLMLKWADRGQGFRLKAETLCKLTRNDAGEAVSEDFILHRDIESIHWPEESNNKKLMIEIRLKEGDLEEKYDEELSPKTDDEKGASEMLDLRKFSPGDWRLLVRYLSKIDVPQHQWNEFCYRYAKRRTGTTKKYLGNGWLASKYEAAPLRTGALLGPLILLRCLMCCSGYLYLIVGVAVLFSALVNTRLLHGTWVPPIGPALLAGGLGAVLFGFFVLWFQSSQESRAGDAPAHDPEQRSIALWSGGILFAVLILVPLLMQFAMIWKLPPAVGGSLIFCVFLPLLPHILSERKKVLRYRDDPVAAHERGNQRWEASWKS